MRTNISNMLILLSILIFPQFTLANFVSTDSYPVGNNPTVVKSADLNGDGFLDVGVVNNADDNISIFLNNGDGTLAAPVNYNGGSFNNSLVFVDVDNDLNLDMIITILNNNEFAVFLNNGDGTFAAPTSFATGGIPIKADTIHLNGDGFVDLLIVTAGDNMLYTYLNDGTGSYLASLTYPVGSAPTDLQVADFNGDTFSDIIVLNSNDENISILLNNGDNTFTGQNYLLGNYPGEFKSADLDGDSDIDLVFAFPDEDAVGVYFNQGDGTFLLNSLYLVANYPLFLDLSDINRDGSMDIISTSFLGNEFRVLFNDGSDGFNTIASDTLLGGPFGVTVANLGPVINGGATNILIVTNTAELLYSILTDYAGPALTEITPVPSTTTDTTPSYTFSSDEVGLISYGGDCSSATTLAVVGNNTITFNELTLGAHNNCEIYVQDNQPNISILTVSPFTIVEPAPIIEFTGGAGGDFGQASCSGTDCENIESPNTPTPSAPSPVTPNPFIDIQNHWAKSYIEDLQNTCKLTGYTDTNGNALNLFKPESPISRAELVTLVIRCKIGSISSNISPRFPDLASNHWAASYIGIAVSEGIIEGYSDGTFRPNQFATRAEAVKIILETYSDSNFSEIAPSSLCSDLDQTAWYAKYFNYALSQEIIQGYLDNNATPSGKCAPENNLTRAEAAKIISLARQS